MKTMEGFLPVLVLLTLLVTGEASRTWERQYMNMTDEEALEKAREVLSNYPLTDG